MFSDPPIETLFYALGRYIGLASFERMAETPHLLLLDEPTRGVDIGARAEIYRMIRDLSAQGCAVLMASTDLPEMLGLCDRILVLQGGRQVQILDAGGLQPGDLLQACYPAEPVA